MTIKVQGISFANPSNKTNSKKSNLASNITNESSYDSVSFKGCTAPNRINEITSLLINELCGFYKNAKYIYGKKYNNLINEFGDYDVTLRFKEPYSPPHFEFNATTNSDINVKLEEISTSGVNPNYALRIGEYSGNNSNERRSIIFSESDWSVKVIDEKHSKGIFEKDHTWKPINEKIETTEMGVEALNTEIQGYLKPLIEKYSKFTDYELLRKSIKADARN